MVVALLACSSGRQEEAGGVQAVKGDGGEVSRTSMPGPLKGLSETGGAYSLEVLPAEAYRSTTLGLKARGFDLPDAEVLWLLNGESASTIAPYSFEVGELGARKGDRVQAVASLMGEEIASNKVTIRNAPPEITRARLQPEVFREGEAIGLEVATEDVDGDDVTISYEWTVNGDPAGQGDELEVPLHRADEFSVRATPFDGEDHGRPVVLQRKVANQPPMITEHYDYTLEDEVYTYQVKAEDPDGDRLTYSLKSAPEGMSIEPETGLVRWALPEGFNGKASFTVSASDGHGAETEQALTLMVKD